MFSIAVPKSQQRRVNQVLATDRSTPMEYDFYKQDDGFYVFNFDCEYDTFKDIILLLKRNGVTTIGADEQLTENTSKIMKLANLFEQTSGPDQGEPSQGFQSINSLDTADEIIAALKKILEIWETKKYPSDRERYEAYYIDIEELVEDYEENKMLDQEDVSDINESKIMNKTKLVDLYKSINDKSLYEQTSPETLMVKLGGDEKTELKISNQTDSTGAVDLSNVTLEFKGEKYEKLEFKFEEVLEDHGNEGKDALFVAESDDKKFEVEVNIDANYDQSGIIEDVEWRSLETFPKEEKNEEKEQPQVNLNESMVNRFKRLANIKK